MSKQTIMLGKKLFEFSSKADWIKGASRIWRLHEVTADNTTCVDQLGRICTMGLHFVEAERDNAYPIEVFITRPEAIPQAQPADQDLPDLIAGSLGVSRGTAYDMMREALELADAALSGANMNMNVVQRKVKTAIDAARTTEGGAA